MIDENKLKAAKHLVSLAKPLKSNNLATRITAIRLRLDLLEAFLQDNKVSKYARKVIYNSICQLEKDLIQVWLTDGKERNKIVEVELFDTGGKNSIEQCSEIDKNIINLITEHIKKYSYKINYR